MWWIYFILTVVSSEEVNQTVDLESARGRPQISDGQEAETHFIIPRSNTKYNETTAWEEAETITAYDPDVEYFNQRATDFLYNEFVHKRAARTPLPTISITTREILLLRTMRP